LNSTGVSKGVQPGDNLIEYRYRLSPGTAPETQTGDKRKMNENCRMALKYSGMISKD